MRLMPRKLSPSDSGRVVALAAGSYAEALVLSVMRKPVG